MIHPSYVELMEVVNEGVDVGDEPVINSRYSIVAATAKRARQLIKDPDSVLLPNEEGKKPLSIAVDELYSGKLRILTDEEAAEEQEKQDAYEEKMREKREREALEREAQKEAEELEKSKGLDIDDEMNSEDDESEEDGDIDDIDDTESFDEADDADETDDSEA